MGHVISASNKLKAKPQTLRSKLDKKEFPIKEHSYGTNISNIKIPVMNSEAVKEIVNSCWDTIEKQCATYVKPVFEVEPVVGKLPVTIFVSSTFKDFHAEREILVKKVFPELREWCDCYQMQLIECDLRWGVPKESTTHTTISTCLGMLDKCHEETDGQPFFLNMISERYGWAPTLHDIPTDIQDTYDWVRDTSITLMEILHGAYRSCNPNAVFFIRDSGYVTELPEDFKEYFIEKDNLPNAQLDMLKKKLVTRFPTQVYHYNCKVSGTETSTTGHAKVNLIGLEDFAEQVLSFFKNAILKTYPNQTNIEELSIEDQENEIQRLFMMKNGEFLAGLEDEYNQIMEFAKGNKDYAIDIMDEGSHCENVEQKLTMEELNKWGLKADDGSILCVKGPAGYGKTTLLAKIVKDLQQTGIDIFYHFVGATSSSSDVKNLTYRLADSFSLCDMTASCADIEPKLVEVVTKIIAQSRSQQDHKLVIILDGLNELSNYHTSQFLAFLPPAFPKNVKCVISAPSDDVYTLARMKFCVQFELSPLEMDARQTLVIHYLGRYNKKLDPEQLNLLSLHTGASVPLWLSIACEELRVFGEFSRVTRRIKEFPESLFGLIKVILTRLINEDDTGYLKKFLCILCLMLHGLRSDDVRRLLDDEYSPVPLMAWATIHRHLKPFLRYIKGHDERLHFCHRSVKEAAYDLVISSPEEKRMWSQHVALYMFQHYKTSDYLLTNEETAYQLSEANQRTKLMEFLERKQRYLRMQYTEKLRCPMRQHSQMMRKVYMCTFCAGRKNAFGEHMPNQQICIVCGNSAYGPACREAFLCYRHQGGLSVKGFEVCCICKKNVPSNLAATTAKLCMPCSSGHQMHPRCVKLEV